jgi:hypothetical protein
MSAEKDGGVTAKALIPAAFLEAKPSRIRVGIKRNPGPTPSKPTGSKWEQPGSKPP